MSFFKKIRNAELKNFFTNFLGVDEVADGTILTNRLVEIDSSGDHVEGTHASKTIVGVNAGPNEVDGNSMELVSVGRVDAISAGPIVAGKRLKGADNGRVIQMNIADEAGTTIDTAVGIEFTNQPANDGVEVLSSESADLDIEVTIIGVTGEVVTVETVSLDAADGTTPVATSKTDWDEILCVKLASTITGTLTVREASGDLAITTITTGNLESGLVEVPVADQSSNGVAPTVVADGATTKMVAIKYINTSGAVAYQADTLAGAVAQTFATAALRVQEIYCGDIEAARTITVATGAEEDENNYIGKALETVTAENTKMKILLSL